MAIEEGLRQVLRHPPGWSEIEIIPCQRCEAYRKEIASLKQDIELLSLIVATEPVELKCEVAVGRNGDLRWPAIRLETGLVIILPSCMKFTSQAIAEECGWTFSPWQPASVKG